MKKTFYAFAAILTVLSGIASAAEKEERLEEFSCRIRTHHPVNDAGTVWEMDEASKTVTEYIDSKSGDRVASLYMKDHSGNLRVWVKTSTEGSNLGHITMFDISESNKNNEQALQVLDIESEKNSRMRHIGFRKKDVEYYIRCEFL